MLGQFYSILTNARPSESVVNIGKMKAIINSFTQTMRVARKLLYGLNISPIFWTCSLNKASISLTCKFAVNGNNYWYVFSNNMSNNRINTWKYGMHIIAPVHCIEW